MKAFALNSIQLTKDDGTVLMVAPKTVFDLSKDQFDALEALPHPAVRVPTKDELTLAKADDAPTPVVVAAPEPEADVAEELTAKHVGAGKFVVVNQAGDTVSGEDRFDGKAAAEKWISDKAAEEELG